ncbi:MAG: hypothetical protein II947_10695 [Bacteroidaceae bacterium]|nr:hypothetical protein [Bacteroidaceae bacterium]
MKKLMMICLMAMSCLMVQAQDFDAFFSKWKDKAGIEYQEITNIRDSLLRQMKENMPSLGSIHVQFDEDSVNWNVETPQDSTSLLSSSEEGFINALFMACLKDKTSAVGIRSMSATGSNMNVAESFLEELKNFKFSNKYEEIFVKNTEEGVSRTYMRKIGGKYELVLLSTIGIGFTQVYGINSSIIHQLIK